MKTQYFCIQIPKQSYLTKNKTEKAIGNENDFNELEPRAIKSKTFNKTNTFIVPTR